MEISGGFDRIDLGVNPAHANIFMDVIHGIKLQNIKEVVESIVSASSSFKVHWNEFLGEYSPSVLLKTVFISQAKKELPLLEASQPTAEDPNSERVLDDSSSVDVRFARSPLPLDHGVLDSRSPFEEPLEKLTSLTTKLVFILFYFHFILKQKTKQNKILILFKDIFGAIRYLLDFF
jgi:hypothetical protein